MYNSKHFYVSEISPPEELSGVTNYSSGDSFFSLLLLLFSNKYLLEAKILKNILCNIKKSMGNLTVVISIIYPNHSI